MMKPHSPSRVSRTKQQARAYYSRLGSFYDLLSGGAEGRLRDDAIRRLNIIPGEKILEIGSGTGGGLLRMAEAAGPSGAAFGVDSADGMLAVSARRLRRCGEGCRTMLVCADGACLPVRPGSFDAVFLSFTLELFDTPEIPAVLAQCRRMLVTGGRLVIVAMALAADPNAMSRLYEAAHKAFPIWVDCRAIDARKAVEEAGFAVLDAVRRSMFALPVDIVICRKG
jgi:ubiquinone/menaquinone biosynthesis C-methylase UbiE